MDIEAPICVAGHRGLFGSAVCRALEAQGYVNLIGATSSEVDLRDRDATMTFFGKDRPNVMIIAVAKVGESWPTTRTQPSSSLTTCVSR